MSAQKVKNVRHTSFNVRNNQTFQVFSKKCDEGFEVWIVGSAKEKRIVLSHYLSHDDLEQRLAYAKTGDLQWRDADSSELPSEKHQNAIEMEETIRRGTFWDVQAIGEHFISISFLPLDRKVCNAAKKSLLGTWTDGFASLIFLPNSELEWACPIDPMHPLNIGPQPKEREPDSWNFTSWQLYLVNRKHSVTEWLPVLRLDEKELHVFSRRPDRVAHILRKAQT